MACNVLYDALCWNSLYQECYCIVVQFSMMSKVKYVIDENVEQDGANYGTLGHTFVHRERSTLGVTYLHTLLPVRKVAA